MNLLLDTHAFLWWMAGDPLSEEAMDRISDPSVLVSVSAASVWEIAIKASLGKVRLEEPAAQLVMDCGFEALPISLAHAQSAGGLPLHHRDPFDRMLIAQAQLEGMRIVTRHPAFGAYPVDLLAC